MARKKPLMHCDAHVLARAVMTPQDFAKIAIQTKEIVNRAAAQSAHRAQRGQAFAVALQSTPPSNTGGKNIKPIELVIDNGVIKQILPRVHYQSKNCFIDWVNFTCHDSTFEILTNAVTDGEVILNVSFVCESIFGFGITNKRERGANFYHRSWDLGDKFGLVCYGGQRNTVLIMLNGEGCSAARAGWELRLYDFLESSQNGRITRLDLSHDDIEGHYFNMEILEAAYDNGYFNCGGKNPDIELRGNWKNPNGKGRSIYIGHRTNGKYLRCYEKGCHLGSSVSKWVRCEVEFKSIDRVIPFNALRYPHEYFSASYPIFEHLSETSERILTVQKTVELSYERTKKWLHRQCGSALNLVNEIEGQEGLAQLFREGKLPKGVVFPSFLDVSEPLHTQPLLMQNFIDI